MLFPLPGVFGQPRLGRITRAVLTIFIAAGTTTTSQAGQAPAPSPAPAPSATPTSMPVPIGPTTGGRGGGVNSGVGKTGRRLGHLPIIDIVPIYSAPQYYTVGPPNHGAVSVNPLVNAGTGYDAVDVGGTFRLPLTPGLWASLDRVVGGTFAAPSARVTTAATKTGAEPYSYPAFTRDVVLVYRLDEQLGPVQFEEGSYFRHRAVGGSNTSATPLLPTISSTEAHFGYAGVTYVSPPIAFLFGSFVSLNINADTQAIDHHVACLLHELDGVAATCPKGNTTGVIDENPDQNRVWETDQYVQLTVPVDKKHGVSLSAQDRWGAFNFYENAPFPYRYTTSQTYILSRRFNRVFSLSLRERDQWVVPQGAPYVKPNATHNGAIDVLADFKLDFNTLH